MPLPKIFDVPQEPLYRADATGERQEEDVAQAKSYILWYVATNYQHRGSLYQ